MDVLRELDAARSRQGYFDVLVFDTETENHGRLSSLSVVESDRIGVPGRAQAPDPESKVDQETMTTKWPKWFWSMRKPYQNTVVAGLSLACLAGYLISNRCRNTLVSKSQARVLALCPWHLAR